MQIKFTLQSKNNPEIGFTVLYMHERTSIYIYHKNNYILYVKLDPDNGFPAFKNDGNSISSVNHDSFYLVNDLILLNVDTITSIAEFFSNVKNHKITKVNTSNDSIEIQTPTKVFEISKVYYDEQSNVKMTVGDRNIVDGKYVMDNVRLFYESSNTIDLVDIEFTDYECDFDLREI